MWRALLENSLEAIPIGAELRMVSILIHLWRPNKSWQFAAATASLAAVLPIQKWETKIGLQMSVKDTWKWR